jgi:hypothetical protein
MKEKDILYQVETSELNQEKMQFLVVNHTPLKMDESVRYSIEEELYKIFEKYAKQS